MAGRTGQLIAFADQRMIILDTRTGRHLRTLRLQDGLSSGMNDGLSRFVTANAAGQVTIYDMHTWKIVKTLRLPVSVPGYVYSAVQPSNGVILMGGTDFNTLYMIDVARGTLRWSLQVPNGAGVHSLLVDERTKRLFAVGAGNFNIHGTSGEPGNGAVTTVDLATHRILRTVAVGAIAFGGVIDAPSGHVQHA